MNSLRYKIVLAIFSLSFLAYACSDSGTGPDVDPAPQFNSKAAPGDSAKSFLEGDQYTTLQIEVDYMEGYEPTQEGLNSLQTFLEERLNKSSITISTTQIAAGGQSSYTTEDIAAIEDEERDNFTEAGSNTLHAYFLIVDGQYSESNVLGIAYWNTSMAFFGQTINEVSGTPPAAPSRQQVEGTVFRHEMGHNMGLVGNGTPTQSDHKTSGSAHCTTDGCLMEPAVETGNVFQNFNGEVPALDQLCIDDLQANGGK